MAKTNELDTGVLWLKLDADSKQLLQKLYPPKYSDPYYDHVTLAFGVPRESVSHLIGQAASANVYAYAHNAKVEAVRVKTSGLPDTYGVPHITLSTQQGVEPFESVAMLKGDHQEVPINPPFELKGQTEFILL